MISGVIAAAYEGAKGLIASTSGNVCRLQIQEGIADLLGLMGGFAF